MKQTIFLVSTLLFASACGQWKMEALSPVVLQDTSISCQPEASDCHKTTDNNDKGRKP